MFFHTLIMHPFLFLVLTKLAPNNYKWNITPVLDLSLDSSLIFQLPKPLLILLIDNYNWAGLPWFPDDTTICHSLPSKLAAQNPVYLLNFLKLRRQDQMSSRSISLLWGLEIYLFPLKSITHELVSSHFIWRIQIIGVQAMTVLSTFKIWDQQMERQGHT